MTDVTAFILAAAAKSSIILAAAALITRVWSRGSAATRHGVWIAAIVAALTVPLVPWLAPSYRVRISAVEASPLVQRLFVATADPGLRAGDGARGSWKAPTNNRQRTIAPSASGERSSAAWSLASVIALLWAAGAALCASLIAGDLVRVHRLLRRARAVASPGVTALVREFARGKRAVPVVESDRITTPMTVGHLSPVIVVPTDHRGWSESRRRAVIAHEVAHTLRRDCLAQFAARTMCALYWFNPLAWYATRAMRAEAERACDDRVLGSGTPAIGYAELLVEFARAPITRPRALWGIPMSSAGAELGRRLEAIVHPAVNRRATSLRQRWAFAAAATATVITLAGAKVDVAQAREARVPSASYAAVTPSSARSSAPVRQSGDSAVARDRGRERPASRDTLDDPRSERIPLNDAAFAAARAATATLTGPDSTLARVLFGALDRAPLHAGDLVAERAAWALARARGDRITESLIDALSSDDWRETAYAGWALAHAPDGRALSPLIALLEHGAWRSRAAAASALASLADPRSVAAMRVALSDEAWQVRSEAVAYFGALGDAESLDAIRAALNDSHIAVRSAAESALAPRRDP